MIWFQNSCCNATPNWICEFNTNHYHSLGLNEIKISRINLHKFAFYAASCEVMSSSNFFFFKFSSFDAHSWLRFCYFAVDVFLLFHLKCIFLLFIFDFRQLLNLVGYFKCMERDILMYARGDNWTVEVTIQWTLEHCSYKAL